MMTSPNEIQANSSVIACKSENDTQVFIDYDHFSNEMHIESSVKIGMVICTAIISLITISGNVMVLAAIFLRPSLRNMRSNTFIASLAFTDLIVGALVMPFSIKYYYYNSHWTSSDTMCHFWIFSDNISCTASIWTLVAIAVDRWLAVHQPVTYMGLKRFSSLLAVFAIWILSVSICVPTAIDVLTIECYCQSVQSDFHFIWTISLVFGLPAFLIVFCYSCIFKKLLEKLKKKRQSRANARNIEMIVLDDPQNEAGVLTSSSWNVVRDWIRQKSFYYEQDPDVGGAVSRKTSSTYLSPDGHGFTRSPPPSPRPSSPINVNEISIKTSNHDETQGNASTVTEPRKPAKVSFKESFRSRRQKMPRSPSNTPNDVAEKREKRVLIQMSVLVLVFLICWLPFWSTFAALHICHYLWPEDIQACNFCGPVAITILQWLGYCNSLLNPFLYTAFNREFRIGFAEIFVFCSSSRNRE